MIHQWAQTLVRETNSQMETPAPFSKQVLLGFLQPQKWDSGRGRQKKPLDFIEHVVTNPMWVKTAWMQFTDALSCGTAAHLVWASVSSEDPILGKWFIHQDVKPGQQSVFHGFFWKLQVHICTNPLVLTEMGPKSRQVLYWLIPTSSIHA